MATHVIYAYPGNINSQKALIAAEFGGITIDYPKDFKMGVDNKTPEFLKWNPNGQVPTMMTPDGPLWESNAMARYIARKADKSLVGNNDYEASQVDQWIEWSRSKFEHSLGDIIGPMMGWREFNQEKHDKSREEVLKAFGILNAALEGKTFLVGNRTTLADVVNIVILQNAFKFAFPLADLKAYPNAVNWFKACVAVPHFKKVLGEITYCEKEFAPGSLKH